mgnify:CR=1 FL=1
MKEESIPKAKRSSRQRLKYKTQWASQFYAAAELTRRGYLVSLTFGNAPVADLLVQSPEGKQFTVDVKGQSTRNFWIIQRREPNPNHNFVLVYLTKGQQPPSFYIFSSDELMKKRTEYEEESTKRGKYRDDMGGFNFTTALAYQDRWDALPE